MPQGQQDIASSREEACPHILGQRCPLLASAGTAGSASCLQLGNPGLGILRQALQKVLRMTTGHSTSGTTPPLPDQMVGVGGSSGAGGVSQLSSQSEPTGGTPWTPPDSAPGMMLLRVPGDTGALQRPASDPVEHKGVSDSGSLASQWI